MMAEKRFIMKSQTEHKWYKMKWRKIYKKVCLFLHQLFTFFVATDETKRVRAKDDQRKMVEKEMWWNEEGKKTKLNGIIFHLILYFEWHGAKRYDENWREKYFLVLAFFSPTFIVDLTFLLYAMFSHEYPLSTHF